MRQSIEYDLDKLIEILTNLREHHGSNFEVRMYDYRTEQFMAIDHVEFEHHSQAILIT